MYKCRHIQKIFNKIQLTQYNGLPIRGFGGNLEQWLGEFKTTIACGKYKGSVTISESNRADAKQLAGVDTLDVVFPKWRNVFVNSVTTSELSRIIENKFK